MSTRKCHSYMRGDWYFSMKLPTCQQLLLNFTLLNVMTQNRSDRSSLYSSSRPTLLMRRLVLTSLGLLRSNVCVCVCVCVVHIQPYIYIYLKPSLGLRLAY